MKSTIVLTLLINCMLFGSPASACRQLSGEQAIAFNEKQDAEARQDVLALKAEADYVFIGRLQRLTFEQETRTSAAGKLLQLQVHQAVFDLVDNIKGDYPEGQVLQFTIQKNLVQIRCWNTVKAQSLPRENGAGERYVVYAKDGIILRTNLIPMHAQPIDARAEAVLLRGVH